MAALAVFLVNTMAAKTPAVERASQQQSAPAPSPEANKQGQGPTMMGENTMAMRRKMMADSKAADAQLQPLVDKMTAAKGRRAKVDAMAAVLTELVRQRTVARGQMDQMSQMMMPNMMGMMMQGMTADMRKMAEQCPMMKGSGDAPPK